MENKNKMLDIYYKIKDVNAKGKYKEVIKYSDKYFTYNDFNDERYIKVLFMKAKALRQLEYYDEAIEILKCGVSANDEVFILELFFLYYHINMYEEALELLPIVYSCTENRMKNYSLSIMEAVMKKQLGIPFNFNEDERLKNKIYDYKEEHTLKHIKSHTLDNIGEDEIKSYFHDSVDLNYLFECTKANLKNNKKANINEIFEIHYFILPNIGIYEGNICNYIKVILIPNTTNIISLYPCLEANTKDVSILNCDFDLLFSNKNTKVKSKSITTK